MVALRFRKGVRNTNPDDDSSTTSSSTWKNNFLPKPRRTNSDSIFAGIKNNVGNEPYEEKALIKKKNYQDQPSNKKSRPSSSQSKPKKASKFKDAVMNEKYELIKDKSSRKAKFGRCYFARSKKTNEVVMISMIRQDFIDEHKLDYSDEKLQDLMKTVDPNLKGLQEKIVCEGGIALVMKISSTTEIVQQNPEGINKSPKSTDNNKEGTTDSGKEHESADERSFGQWLSSWITCSPRVEESDIEESNDINSSTAKQEIKNLQEDKREDSQEPANKAEEERMESPLPPPPTTTTSSSSTTCSSSSSTCEQQQPCRHHHEEIKEEKMEGQGWTASMIEQVDALFLNDMKKGSLSFSSFGSEEQEDEEEQLENFAGVGAGDEDDFQYASSSSEDSGDSISNIFYII